MNDFMSDYKIGQMVYFHTKTLVFKGQLTEITKNSHGYNFSIEFMNEDGCDEFFKTPCIFTNFNDCVNYAIHLFSQNIRNQPHLQEKQDITEI
jgi:hypothetical protein